MADLKKERDQELVKPTAKSGNEHDPEPTNVQTNAEVKKWKMKKSQWVHWWKIDKLLSKNYI